MMQKFSLIYKNKQMRHYKEGGKKKQPKTLKGMLLTVPARSCVTIAVVTWPVPA